MGHTGIGTHFGCGGLEDGPDTLVGLLRPARHDAGSAPRPFLAARNTHAQKVDSPRHQALSTRIGVLEMGIAAVDDEVARFEMTKQIVEDRIHRSASGHQHHDRARPPQRADEGRDVARALDVRRRGFPAQGLDLRGILVVAHRRKAVPGHVQQQIASHDAQTDHADLAARTRD